MKKVFLIALLVLSVGIIGCDKAEASGSWDPCSSKYGSQIWNSCIEDRRNEVGVGTDIVLYEGKDGEVLNRLTVEYRYDWANGENKTYLFATSKLADILAAAKGLINRD